MGDLGSGAKLKPCLATCPVAGAEWKTRGLGGFVTTSSGGIAGWALRPIVLVSLAETTNLHLVKCVAASAIQRAQHKRIDNQKAQHILASQKFSISRRCSSVCIVGTLQQHAIFHVTKQKVWFSADDFSSNHVPALFWLIQLQSFLMYN